ncbi:MAG: hypothetical protein HC814_06510 [Rhodobacteraceae bacterium]|nr:hypothetical protein [Paracoccaceae bacterium]
MGGHSRECNQCGHESYHYNSCNNRNCPKSTANRFAKPGAGSSSLTCYR